MGIAITAIGMQEGTQDRKGKRRNAIEATQEEHVCKTVGELGHVGPIDL
jgi:hypothetical protein